MTASDIPLTTGQTDQGGEGQRFMGYTVYDSLVEWDLSKSDKPSVLVPGLATSWAVDAGDKTKWVFKLREGVKFHDGSTFDANAVVWNFDKLLKNDAPQFDPRQAAQGRSRIPAVASYRMIDPLTVEITTKTPDATLPYQVAWILLSSPANWEAQGKSWEKVAQKPSGTGPWQPGERLHAARARRADAVHRLLGQGARAEARQARSRSAAGRQCARRGAPLGRGRLDRGARARRRHSLKTAGFTIMTNAYPHNWTWHFSRVEGSPWNDIRVRKAANLAIDRDGMKELLGGLMIPATGFFPPGHQWFGNPSFKVKYDVAAAKKLMAEAGFGPNKKLKTKVLIAPSGFGPDDSAADERISAAEPRRNRHRHRV